MRPESYSVRLMITTRRETQSSNNVILSFISSSIYALPLTVLTALRLRKKYSHSQRIQTY